MCRGLYVQSPLPARRLIGAMFPLCLWPQDGQRGARRRWNRRRVRLSGNHFLAIYPSQAFCREVGHLERIQTLLCG